MRGKLTLTIELDRPSELGCELITVALQAALEPFSDALRFSDSHLVIKPIEEHQSDILGRESLN